MLVFLLTVFGLYALLVIALTWGWALLTDHPVQTSTGFKKIAVVIAFRNEKESLPGLIADLKALDYPRDLVEFNLVDDHSEDTSADVARDIIGTDDRFRLVTLKHPLSGKKSAVATGVQSALAEIVITTDADCRVPPQWLKAINNEFNDANARMIVGPVTLVGGGLESIQSMEFASLIGTAGATIALGRPTMCNAANLAFRREDFLVVDGFEGNEHVSSGDDQFLMNKFIARWKNSIRFLHNTEAVVKAHGSGTITDFFRQRLRWAGKWSLSPNTSSWLALAILGFHACNIGVAIAWVYGSISTPAYVTMVGSKLFAEMIFLFPVCRFLGLRWRWSSFLFLQLFYSLYVIGIGFSSQTLAARWKGREVSTGNVSSGSRGGRKGMNAEVS